MYTTSLPPEAVAVYCPGAVPYRTTPATSPASWGVGGLLVGPTRGSPVCQLTNTESRVHRVRCTPSGSHPTAVRACATDAGSGRRFKQAKGGPAKGKTKY